MSVSFSYKPDANIFLVNDGENTQQLPVNIQTFLGYPRRQQLLASFWKTQPLLAKRFQAVMAKFDFPSEWKRNFEQGIMDHGATCYEQMMANQLVTFINGNRQLFLQ